jgi:hypothetical protein
MEPSLDTTEMLDYRYIFELSIKKTDQSMAMADRERPARVMAGDREPA